ncbi:MAG TPA: hypothetical protein VFO86_00420, partial [Terriglobia bacterium]|nr:hypothetical protein [Terriglobia bacterium]
MATRWLRWNTTSHIFEYSTDGVTFNVLPLNASILNEGSLSDARLSANVPLLNVANIFTGNPTRLSAAAPSLQYNETDQGAGLKNWSWGVDGGVFSLVQLDDAFASPVTLLSLTRGGRMATLNGFDVGGSLQSDALIRSRKAGNNYEFGHPNASGFISSLGSGAGNGRPHLAFSAEHGTNTNTFLTRGNPGSVMQGDLTGGFLWGKVPTASADNQALTTLMTLTNAGVLNLALDGII